MDNRPSSQKTPFHKIFVRTADVAGNFTIEKPPVHVKRITVSINPSAAAAETSRLACYLSIGNGQAGVAYMAGTKCVEFVESVEATIIAGIIWYNVAPLANATVFIEVEGWN